MTWDKLEKTCQTCRKCSLSDSRNNTVFGIGNRTAEILFIGEAPGEQEDLRGEPFVGRAGKLLDNMLSVIDLNRSNIYISNIIKCRPPSNRDPLHVEQDACIAYLYEQIALLQPKIIVCLGRIAAQKIIDKNFKISKEHGHWYECFDVPTMALYHPAALLRDPRRKPDTFLDLKELQRKIQEICERTYL